MSGPTTLRPGFLLGGRYRLLDLLDEGGMSVIWRAETADRSEHVAIKMLHEALLGDDPSLRQRFQREVRALFALRHPHLLRVFDSGVQDGKPYLVMELLQGHPLDRMMESGPPDPALALALFRQIASGLAFAHAQGVLHRDLKSENVFVTRRVDGAYHAKLLDFGLAKFTDGERWGQDAPLTVAGTVFGTPAYMSPEQATGAPMDTRSDVYSLGAILYELLTGEWPFMEEDRVEMLRAHLTRPPAPLGETRSDLAVRPELEALVAACLAKRPDDRPRDAGVVLSMLDALPPDAATARGGGPATPGARGGGGPWGLVAAGVGLFVIAVAAAAFFTLGG